MNEGWLITIPFLILYVDNRCIVPKKICEISIVTASFIGRDVLGRADIRVSAAGEPEGGRGPVRDDGVCLTTVRPALGRA